MSRRNVSSKKKTRIVIDYARFIPAMIIILGIVIGSIYGISSIFNKEDKNVKGLDIYTEEKKLPEKVKEPETYKLSVTAGGDLLIHDTIFKSVKTSTGYNFDPIFSDVKYLFENSDLSVINLEVPVAGNILAPSNYPMFNSPVELLDAVKTMGVDIVSTANNHALDKRYAGLEATIANAKARDLKVVGTATKIEDSKPAIISKNNIKIGIAAYTFGTNGMPIPTDYPFCVNIIDKDKMLADISYMKAQGADFIFFTIHFGQEYQLTPNDTQKDLVDFLISNGVDVIFGSHPHVPQPYELREVTLADGTKKQAFVIYSLGNFVSNQTDYYTKLGGVATVKLSKKADVKKIDSFEVTPIYTDYTKGAGINTFKVIPLKKAIDDYESGVKKYTQAEIDKFKKMLEDTNSVYTKLQK